MFIPWQNIIRMRFFSPAIAVAAAAARFICSDTHTYLWLSIKDCTVLCVVAVVAICTRSVRVCKTLFHSIFHSEWLSVFIYTFHVHMGLSKTFCVCVCDFRAFFLWLPLSLSLSHWCCLRNVIVSLLTISTRSLHGNICVWTSAQSSGICENDYFFFVFCYCFGAVQFFFHYYSWYLLIWFIGCLAMRGVCFSVNCSFSVSGSSRCWSLLH